MAEAASVVALDVGGTAIKAAVIDIDGCVRASISRPTARPAGPDAVVEQILTTAAELGNGAGAEARAAGVAVPGQVDELDGVARSSANLGWRDVPLRALLEERLGVPAVLRHDVAAGALAEGILGAGRGLRNYLFVTIGTGIGGAMVLDGKPYRGRDGFAGEIGHMIIEPGGAACGCGRRGCLETIASAARIAERYAAASGEAGAGAELVVDRAQAGDETAVRVWEAAVAALALAFANYAALMVPEAIILGGGLAHAGDALFAPLERELRIRLPPSRVPRLLPTQLGSAAGCRGAALSAWLALGVARDELRWNGDP